MELKSRKNMMHTAGFEIFVSLVELHPHRKFEYGTQKPENLRAMTHFQEVRFSRFGLHE